MPLVAPETRIFLPAAPRRLSASEPLCQTPCRTTRFSERLLGAPRANECLSIPLNKRKTKQWSSRATHHNRHARIPFFKRVQDFKAENAVCLHLMWCLVRATSDQTLAAPSPDVYQTVHKKKQIVLKCSVSATHLHLHRINASVIWGKKEGRQGEINPDFSLSFFSSVTFERQMLRILIKRISINGQGRSYL